MINMKCRELLNANGIKQKPGYCQSPELASPRSSGIHFFKNHNKFGHDPTLTKEPFHRRRRETSRLWAYFQHHRLLLFLVDGDVCAVYPGVGAQVSETDIGVPEGKQWQWSDRGAFWVTLQLNSILSKGDRLPKQFSTIDTGRNTLGNQWLLSPMCWQ